MFILWFLAWSPQVPILLMCKLLILYQRHGSLIDYIKNLSNEFLLNYVFRLWEHSEILIWNCRYYKKFMIHYGSEGAIHRCWKNSFINFFFKIYRNALMQESIFAHQLAWSQLAYLKTAILLKKRLRDRCFTLSFF